MKLLKSAALILGLFVVTHASAFGQDAVGYTPANAEEAARIAYAGAARTFSFDMRAIGVALVIIGAAIGIGWLARAAVESMARQPEVAGNIQTAMIIAAALIEGVTFFALIIIMLFVSPF